MSSFTLPEGIEVRRVAFEDRDLDCMASEWAWGGRPRFSLGWILRGAKTTPALAPREVVQAAGRRVSSLVSRTFSTPVQTQSGLAP